jgi:hypothetical protein
MSLAESSHLCHIRPQYTPLIGVADTPSFGIEFSEIGLVGVAPVLAEHTPVEQNPLLVTNDVPFVAVVAYKRYTEVVLGSDKCGVVQRYHPLTFYKGIEFLRYGLNLFVLKMPTA